MGHKNYILTKSLKKTSLKIWRYIDFTKLVSLLDKKSLYFTRIDKLEDSFEGSYPTLNIEIRKYALKGESDILVKNMPKLFKEIRKFFAVNSWCIMDHESVALWKSFTNGKEGIAIQSTIQKLLNVLEGQYEKPVYFGKIGYINYAKDLISGQEIFAPYLHKRESFEYEHELRAIVVNMPTKKVEKGEKIPEIDIKREVWEHGLYIPVDLKKLIEKIYVSPVAPKWFHELVCSVTKRYNLNTKVIQSNLAKDPVY